MSATGKQSGEDGFTLLEALVVVALTGLLGGLMFPRLQGAVAGQEFRTARSAMILGVREARAQAIRSGREARFLIAAGGTGFQVQGKALQAIPASVQLGKGGGSDTPLSFYADGTSNGGRLALVSRDRRAEFIVFPTTGLIAEARE
jgi:general secretion pathway protein H